MYRDIRRDRPADSRHFDVTAVHGMINTPCLSAFIADLNRYAVMGDFDKAKLSATLSVINDGGAIQRDIGFPLLCH